MSITSEQKVDFFRDELSYIESHHIREFVKLCIMSGPDYFFTDCPASSSGKYHSVDELSWDGTMIHTKRVFILGYSLSRAFGLEKDRDIILGACLIHDLVKQGETQTGHTVKNHPQLAANLIHKIQKETQLLSEDEFTKMYNSVKFHYGPWTIKHSAKPMSEFTLDELCVFISDYVASKRFITVKYSNDCYEK